MELTELRERIDVLDRALVELMEQRMDVAADIAAYKAQKGLPVLDAGREAEKLAAVEALCRPETGPLLREVFAAVMAASRAYQTALREGQAHE